MSVERKSHDQPGRGEETRPHCAGPVRPGASVLVKWGVACGLVAALGWCSVAAAEYCGHGRATQFGNSFVCSDVPGPDPAAAAGWTLGRGPSAIGRWVELRFDSAHRIRQLTVAASCRNGRDHQRFPRIAGLRIESADGLRVEVRLLDQPAEQTLVLPRWVRSERIRATVTALHTQGAREDTVCIGDLSADLEEQSRIESGRMACEVESAAPSLRRCLAAHLARLDHEIERAFVALQRHRERLDRQEAASGRASRHAAHASEAQAAWNRWREAECAAIRALPRTDGRGVDDLTCRIEAGETRLWQLRELSE